jgi:hypothetical protein
VTHFYSGKPMHFYSGVDSMSDLMRDRCRARHLEGAWAFVHQELYDVPA